MKRLLAILTAAMSLSFGSSAHAGQLSGTINLADVGTTVAGVTFTGIDAGDSSGYSVSNAGDVNGDGLDDLLIGATEAAPNGEAYLVYGRNGTSAFSSTFELTNADVIFSGIDVSFLHGLSVSTAGDVNADGIDDLLIGSYWADTNGSKSGGTYLVYGRRYDNNPLSGTFDLTNADVIFNGVDSGDMSGVYVSNAGDVNGDGVDDLLIGAHQADPNGVGSGETYLVYGKSYGSALSGTIDLEDIGGSVAGVVFNGIDTNDSSGRYVSNAGDVNGDGIDDLLIGAYRVGEIYLLYGRRYDNNPLSGTFELMNADVCFKGDNFSGVGISNAGDVNDDGVDDLLIGAFLANSEAGRTYLVYGQREGSALTGTIKLSDIGGSVAGVIFNGIDRGDKSGFSVSYAGDTNGDGTDDLLIGAQFANPNGNEWAGETYLVYGRRYDNNPLSGTFDLTNADVIFNGIDVDDRSGVDVSNAGDVNDDGLDDLLIGSVWSDPNGMDSGETYLIYGQAIPEPGTLALVGLGLFGLARKARSKRCSEKYKI